MGSAMTPDGTGSDGSPQDLPVVPGSTEPAPADPTGASPAQPGTTEAPGTGVTPQGSTPTEGATEVPTPAGEQVPVPPDESVPVSEPPEQPAAPLNDTGAYGVPVGFAALRAALDHFADRLVSELAAAG